MIEIGLKYLKAQKEQGGRVMQWEGNKQTARTYASAVRSVLKSMNRSVEDVISQLTDENFANVVNEIYEMSKTMKNNVVDTDTSKKDENDSVVEKVESAVNDEKTDVNDEKSDEKTDEPDGEKPLKLNTASGRDIIRRNVQRSRQISKMYVSEKARKEKEVAVHANEDASVGSEKSFGFLKGLFGSPLIVGLMIGVLAIVIFLIFGKKSDKSGGTVVSAPKTESQPVYSTTPLNDMFADLNRMFGAEMWKP